MVEPVSVLGIPTAVEVRFSQCRNLDSKDSGSLETQTTTHEGLREGGRAPTKTRVQRQ